MREHLGVDVDAMYEQDLMASEPVENPLDQEVWDPDSEQQYGQEGGVTKVENPDERTPMKRMIGTLKDTVNQGMGRSHILSATRLTSRQLLMRPGKQVPQKRTELLINWGYLMEQVQPMVTSNLRRNGRPSPMTARSNLGLLVR